MNGDWIVYLIFIAGCCMSYIDGQGNCNALFFPSLPLVPTHQVDTILFDFPFFVSSGLMLE